MIQVSGATYFSAINIEYDTSSAPTTVATPTFSPEGGTYTSAQNVSIDCTTSGATIHYTTDGSDPTSSSDVYSTPIAISTTTTLKAIAIKDGVTSAIAPAQYNIASSAGLQSAMILFSTSGTSTLNNTSLYDAIAADSKQYVSSVTNVSSCYANNGGVRLSSASNGGEFTLNLADLINGKNVTQIVVNAKAWSSSENGQFSISEVAGSTTTVNTTSLSDYTINVNPAQQLSTLTIQGVAEQRLTIQSITLIFEEEGDYAITSTVQPLEGGVITNLRSTADQGDDIAFDVTAATGYGVTSVEVTAGTSTVEVTYSDTDGKYHFTMPASDVTVTATFALAWNAVGYTVSPEGAGQVWMIGGTEVSDGVSKSQMGTLVTVKVVPGTGYAINTVTATDAGGNSVALTTGETNGSHGGWGTYYTFTMPGSAVTINATFKQGDLYILGDANGNQWAGNVGVKMDYDSANEKYTKDVYFANDTYGYFSFTEHLGNADYSSMGTRYGATAQNKPISSGQDVVQQGENAFKIPAGIYTIEVNKAKTQLIVTPKEITVTIAPNGGQVEQGTEVTVSSNLTQLLKTIDNSLNATLSTSTDGTNYTEGNSYILGTTGTTTVYGKAAYGAIEQPASAEFTVVKHYSVTCTANPTAGGTVSANPESAQQGETVTLTITTKEGYELTSVTVNGEEITATDGGYSFVMPAQDAAVVANFTPINYNITVVKSNCEVTVAETAAYNSQVTFTVTPRSDKYEVSSVSVTYGENGTKPVTYNSVNGTYSFFMPASDVTLTVLCTRKAVGNVYTLVEKTEDLVSDQKYIILAKNYTAAMSTDLNSKSTNYTLSEEGKKATVTGDDVLVLTLSEFNVGDETEWTLVNNGRYLNLPSGGDLKWSSDLESFPITISGGIATINGYTTNNPRQLLYRNNSGGIFKNYASSNADASGYSVVQLYKQTTASTQVTISPEGGSVIGSQEVEVDATTETAVVRYQVDNGDWSEWTTGPVNFTLTGNVGDTKVVTAQAMEPNQELEEGEEAEMDEASATYTFVAPNAPTVTPGSCHITDIKQSVTITSSYADGTIEYSTDGGTTWETYSGKFNVEVETFGQSVTVQARVTVNGVTSGMASATYTRDIQPVVFSPASGTYRGDQTCQMFSITKGARIYYTTDGSDPVMNQGTTRLYTGEIEMPAPGTYTFKAVAYIGTTASTVTSAEYTIQNKYTSGNYLYSVAELNAMDATSVHWTMVNPVQVIYMSTYQQNGYQPEYCLVRDNTGYGMIYFGKENTSHNNYHVFGMGDWIAGGYDGPISNFKYTPEGESQQVVADTHPELGTSTHGKQINYWPSSAMSNSPVLPEYLDIPTILSSDPTDADKDYWGHYVHLRKTSVALTEKDNDAKWAGIITDENGEQINYYDKFYLQSAEDWTVENNLFTGHDNRTFDVYGFVAYYRGDYQISPFAFAWIDQPTCSHATDEYTSAQQVTLTSDEDPEATIWYKTSEMDDYAIYHRGSTITVNSTTTIEWYATKMSDFNDELESKRGSVTLTFVEIAKPEISPKSVVKTVGESVDATIAFEQGKNVPDDAVIIYTTDGTDPKAGNQVYTLGTTMTFNTTTTVRAITRTGSEGNYVYSAEAEPQTYSFVKSNGVVYELVTDVNQLTESGVYMIVSKNYGEALSTTQNAANRGAAGVMFVEGSNKTKVYGNSDVALFQLSHLTHSDDQSGDNHFLFHTGNGANDAANGYLYVGHETDNTLLTESEEDDLGNDVVLVTIDSDGRAHLQMNYSGGSNRYIQYWNRDRYFTTYKTEDTDRAVYIYYTASTPLAVIEQSGTKGKSYTVADDLQVVYVTSTNDYSVAWARDLVDNNQAVDVPTEADGVYDYMTNAGQQTGQWQQNNWVMLDFGDHADFNDLVAEFTAGKQPIIKGGSLVGEYTDDVNYTIRVSHDAKLELEQAEPYVPNVYCAANYYGEPTQLGTNGRTYWFMTPKVMEVATHTWSVYQSGDNAGFYMPESKFIDGQWFNEAGLLGAYGLNMQYNEGTFTPEAGQAYRYLGVTLVKGTEGTTATAAPRHAPTSLEAQPGSAISANREVAPLNLTGSIEQVVTAVSHITAGREVLSVTYSDVAGRQSSKPFDGVNIIVTRYTDGTTTTRKALF
ncbi:MAG: chitobiase/beta-hexosaminidase C-terminal domain-containing protein [Muribaculaceae bacterium]|nr:chitobiase/beta-hexosaminidase C-terminal domain-containing protein [Muribaculaceae bacterium]